jgi:hypothetical protein
MSEQPKNVIQVGENESLDIDDLLPEEIIRKLDGAEVVFGGYGFAIDETPDPFEFQLTLIDDRPSGESLSWLVRLGVKSVMRVPL